MHRIITTICEGCVLSRFVKAYMVITQHITFVKAVAYSLAIY